MDILFTIIGFIGAGAFASCTLPQILRVLKRKSTADISLLFILLSLLGNLASASYIIYTNIHGGFWQIPQYFNYTIATTLVVTLLVLKLKCDGHEVKESFKKRIANLKGKFYVWCSNGDLQRSIEIVVAAVLSIFMIVYLVYSE